MNTVTIKSTFKPSRPRRANTAPTLPAVATEAATSTMGPTTSEKAPTRPPCRVARMLALAYLVDRQVESGAITSHAEAGRLLGVSRARMAQVLALLTLAPAIQDGLLLGRLKVTERELRGVVQEPTWLGQLKVCGIASGTT